MTIADLSIKRPIMMSMFLIVFALFGSMAYFGMPLDLFPVVNIPYITVKTTYAGAGPKEIETQITKKIEDAVSSVSEIDQMISYSMEGVSLVMIKFELAKDPDIANQEVKDKVDAIVNNLPDDADIPIVQKYNVNEKPILEVVLSGPLTQTELYELADKRLKDRFAQIPGVAQVNLSGGQEREVQVILDDRTVFQNTIDLNTLSQILSAQNIDIPAGNFKRGNQEYTVRLSGEFEDPKEIADLEVPTSFGMKRIKDIAEVKDTGEEVRQRVSYFNNIEKAGSPDAVLLSLVKNSEGNSVEIAKDVKKVLPEMQASLPAGTQLEIVTDKSVFVESSVEDTLVNILLGIVLTSIVLLFFLHDLRSTTIVAISMPMSILSAFMIMQASGFSLNMMSLMGLSTAVGVLVTNSVVVLENIFRHKEMGNGRVEAASKGTNEVVVAVVASALTNIAVFLPIAQMTSIVGQFFREFALTVTYATIFSLIISFTLTPMLASLLLPEEDKKKHPIGEALEKMFHFWETLYKRSLEAILQSKWRAVGVIATAIILFILSLPLAGKIGFEFVPLTDEGDIDIELELPEGTNLEKTAELLSSVEARLREIPEVKHLLMNLGRINDYNVGTNLVLIKLKLVSVHERSESSEAFTSKIIQMLSDFPDIRLRVRAVSSIGGSEQAPILFYLMGQDNDLVNKYKDEILAKISDVPGLVNLNSSSRSGKPEINLTPDRKKLSDAGLTIYDLAMNVRGAVNGLVSTQYKEQGEEYDIRLMLDDAAVDSPEKIANITLSTSMGSLRLSQLCDIEFKEGYSKIMHKDKFKAVEFSASSAPGVPMGNVVSEINAKIAEIDLPSGYKITWGGDAEMMQDTAVDMLRTFIIAIILTYMLLAAILESFTQPLIILGTVPLAMIGVFGSMYITGKSMNIISMLSIVMLLGIVVNNAILMLSYTNELREKGMSIYDALIEACPTKLKPILMSTIAIILGMLPMAMGFGDAGREIRQPMGIVAIGGLVVSTFLTLFVIPAIYDLTSREKKAQS
ncbi:acriflavin resistance protein [Chloroherpeton thalassium ATCC 35110]|uniref:Acriflavin resistance protein n=1 Tax=Chloroherpeton thalassium (strain ATCC 35110 / GB-78) TaxID=517418 RepID=B3QYU9_CHLT3|nr:efflux RND transporter permease subunit [Chloroherpeton thalassium]ACF15172.1 acriflavin resistance protein [Chloroherpeton thalassium ATCC 35110]